MTKEQWLEIKHSKQFPMELFYGFYQIHNDRPYVMNPFQFRDSFQHYCFEIGRVPTENIIQYYDEQFGITTKLLNKDGQLIKEY